MGKTIYSVIIVEDEPHSITILEKYVENNEFLKLKAIAKDGKTALQKLQTNSYDLVLLDINLPQLSGIEIIDKLSHIPHIIFVTTYDTYAVKAFEIGAVDYLVKPVSPDRFNTAIERFLQQKNSNNNFDFDYKQYSLSFKSKRLQHLVTYKDIVYIAAHDRHSVIHTISKDFETSSLLKEIEAKLKPELFIRIHRKYIVNIHFLESIQYDSSGQYSALLKDEDDTILPIGRSSLHAVKNIIAQ